MRLNFSIFRSGSLRRERPVLCKSRSELPYRSNKNIKYFIILLYFVPLHCLRVRGSPVTAGLVPVPDGGEVLVSSYCIGVCLRRMELSRGTLLRSAMGADRQVAAVVLWQSRIAYLQLEGFQTNKTIMILSYSKRSITNSSSSSRGRSPSSSCVL